MRQTHNSAMRPIAECIRNVCLPAASLFLSLNSGAVLAGPEGGQVVGGQGNISAPNTTTTVINQQSQNLAIDWTSFNVDTNELVQFNQPSKTASALNRIYDQNPSKIFGTINANGNVLLVNPNGVFFSPTASINVNSLIASGLDISTSDFMGGKLNFFGVDGKDGIIVNQGLLQAATGGAVTLIGKAVSNEGVILASAGTVNLIAGDQVTIDFDGDGLMQFAIDKEVLTNAQSLDAAVSNTGEINADGGSVLLTGKASKDIFSNVVNNEGMIKAGRIENRGGSIRLVASGTSNSLINTGTLNVSGTNGDGGTVQLQSTDTTIVAGNSVIDASSSDANGGNVQILGDKAGLFDNASINVSGATGGGEVLIGGDYQGKNPDIQNASVTYVGGDTSINADAITEGDGGKVIVWADDTTRYYGDVTARGGSDSGDGGFVEVSGKSYLDFHGTVDTTAAKGETGTLLLDPTDITIMNGSGDGAADGTTTFAGAPSGITGTVFEADTGPSTIFESELEGLAIATDIELQASNNITMANLTDNLLDLTTIGSVTFTADSDNNGVGDFISDISDTISTAGASLTISGASLTLGSLASNGGAITLTAGAPGTGSISMVGVDAGGSNVTLSADGTVTQTGAITNTNLLILTSAGGAGTAVFTLTNTGNTVTTLDADSASLNTVTFTDNGTGFNVDGINTTTAVTLNSAGAIGQIGIIQGTGTLTKEGIGTLLLDQANTYTGLTTVSAGTIALGVNDGINATNDLTIATGATFDLAGFDASLGTLSNDGTFQLEGGETITITTMDTDSGLVFYVGDGTAGTLTVNDFGSPDYFNLEFDDAGSGNTFQLGAGLDVEGNITITGGTLDSNGNDINVAGNWSNSDTFSAGGDTVTFDGTGTQDVTSGGSAFNTLVTNKTAASDLNFLDSVTIDTLTTNAAAFNIAFNGAATVATDTTFTNTGSVTLGDDSADVLLFDAGLDTQANSSTLIGGIVRTSGDVIDFGAVTLIDNATVDTTNNGGNAAGANIDFRSTVDADLAANNRTLTVNAGTGGTARFRSTVGATQALADFDVTANLIRLAGNVTADQGAGGAIVTLDGPVQLDATLAIDATGNDLTVTGVVTSNGTNGLTVDTGTGAVDFQSTVGSGGSNELGQFIINTAGDVNLQSVETNNGTIRIGTDATTRVGTLTLNDDLFTHDQGGGNAGALSLFADNIIFEAAGAGTAGSITLDTSGGTDAAITLHAETSLDSNTAWEDGITINAGASTFSASGAGPGSLDHADLTAASISLGDFTLGDGAGNGGVALSITTTGDLTLDGDISTTGDSSGDAGAIDLSGVAGDIILVGGGATDATTVTITTDAATTDAAITLGDVDGDGVSTLNLAIDAGTEDVTLSSIGATNAVGILTVGGNDIDFSGNVEAASITATAIQGADNDSIDVTGAFTLDANGGAITFTSDAMAINTGATLSSTGAAAGIDITFQGETDATTIGVGGGTGTLQLSEAELQTVSSDFTDIIIGSATQTGLIDVNGLTINNTGLQLNIESSVTTEFTLDGALNITNDGSAFAVVGTGISDLGANINTDGGTVDFDGDVIISADDVTIKTDNNVAAGAAITFDSAIDAVDDNTPDRALILDAGTGGTVTVSGDIGASEAFDDTTDGVTITGGDINLQDIFTSAFIAGGHTQISGPVTINASGTVTIGDINSSNGNGANAGDISITGNGIMAIGAIDSSSGDGQNSGDVTILNNSATGGDNITISGDIDASSSTANDSTGGVVTIDASGSNTISLLGIDVSGEDFAAPGDVILLNTLGGTGTITLEGDLDTSLAAGGSDNGGNIVIGTGLILGADITNGDDVDMTTTAPGTDGNITFNGTVDSDTGTEGLTVDLDMGDLVFAGDVGVGTSLGDVTITDAHDVTFQGAFNAASFTQTAGSGTNPETIFGNNGGAGNGGDTNITNDINISTEIVTIQDNVTAGGMITIAVADTGGGGNNSLVHITVTGLAGAVDITAGDDDGIAPLGAVVRDLTAGGDILITGTSVGFFQLDDAGTDASAPTARLLARAVSTGGTITPDLAPDLSLGASLDDALFPHLVFAATANCATATCRIGSDSDNNDGVVTFTDAQLIAFLGGASLLTITNTGGGDVILDLATSFGTGLGDGFLSIITPTGNIYDNSGTASALGGHPDAIAFQSQVGGLTLETAGGSIGVAGLDATLTTDVGSLTVTTTVGGSIDITDVGGTDTTYDITTGGAGDVSLIQLASNMIINGLSTTGAFTASSAGTITDAIGTIISVGGLASISATGAITLGDDVLDTTNFGTLTLNSANAVVVTEDGSTQLVGTNTADSLVLTSAAGITDAVGTSVTVTNNADFVGTSITLADDAGDTLSIGGTASFDGGAGAVTVAAAGAVDFGSLTFNSTAGAVNITEDDATNLIGTSTADSLDLNSAVGIDNTAAATLNVTNLADFDGTSIDLGVTNAGTFNFGTLTFNSAGSVAISENSAMTLTGTNTADSLDLDSTAAITDDAAGTTLTVTNLADFNGTSMTLGDNVGDTTNFGTLTFNSAGAVNITEDTAMVLAGTSTADTLTLTSNGTLTDTGSVAVTGVTVLDAGANDILLGSIGNDFDSDASGDTLTATGNNISITDANSLVIGTITAANNLIINMDAGADDTASLDLSGATITAAGVISLDGQGTNDTLLSTDTTNLWTITGLNNGNFNDGGGQVFNFTDFATIVGADTNVDTITQAAALDVVLTAAGTVDGVAGGITGLINFDNIDVINGAINSTLTGFNTTATWTLDGFAENYLDTGSTQDLDFSANFTDLTGGGGADTFNITTIHTGNLKGDPDGAGNDGADSFVFNDGGFIGTARLIGSIDGGVFDGAGGAAAVSNDTIDFTNSLLVLLTTPTGPGTDNGQQGTILDDPFFAAAPDTDLITGTFDNINSLAGNGLGGLVGPDINTIWIIDGINAGTFGVTGIETAFTNFSILGGSLSDTFIFTTGTLTGNVDGGTGAAGENNTLIIDTVGAQIIDITGTSSGDVGGLMGVFQNIDNVFGSANADTINIATGVVFGGTIGGGLGSDTLNVVDTGTWTITGLGTRPDIYDVPDAGTTAVDGTGGRILGNTFVEMEILNASTGTDFFSIERVDNALTINADSSSGVIGGNDFFNLLNVADVDQVLAALTIRGDLGADVIQVNDLADTTADTGSITSTTIDGIFGGGSVNYSDGAANVVEDINIFLGQGDDNFTVVSTDAASPVLVDGRVGNDTINVQTIASQTDIIGNVGDDIINIGSAANSLDGILATLTIAGNTHTAGDTLNINDQDDAENNNYAVTASSVTRTSPSVPLNVTINYNTIENLSLNTGAGTNAITATGWAPQTGTITDAGGVDTFTLNANTTVSGDFTINNVETVTDTGATLGADQLTISNAITGITSFDTSVNSLLITGSGATIINEVNSIDILGVDTGAASFNLTAANGSITNSAGQIIAGDTILIANGATSFIGTSAQPIQTDLTGGLSALAPGGTGGVFINDAGALSVATITASTGGNVELTAVGAITERVTDTFTNITGSIVTLNAASIGTGGVNEELDVSASTQLNADTSGSNGDISIRSPADIPVGIIDAGAAGDVFLTAATGSITDNASLITAANLDLTATIGSIGSAFSSNFINTDIATSFDLIAGAGQDIAISDANVLDTNQFTTLSNGTGFIVLESLAGPFTVSSNPWGANQVVLQASSFDITTTTINVGLIAFAGTNLLQSGQDWSNATTVNINSDLTINATSNVIIDGPVTAAAGGITVNTPSSLFVGGDFTIRDDINFGGTSNMAVFNHTILATGTGDIILPANSVTNINLPGIGIPDALLAIDPVDGTDIVFGTTNGPGGQIKSNIFSNFNGHLIVGGTYTTITNPVIQATALDISANSITVSNALTTNGPITFLAGGIVLDANISAGGPGGGALAFVAAGDDANFSPPLAGTGDIQVDSLINVDGGSAIFVAENLFTDPKNVSLDLNGGVVEVAIGGVTTDTVVEFGPGTDASTAGTNGSVDFNNFLGLFNTQFNILQVQVLNPAADLIGLEELGFIDTGLFELDLTLFGVIGDGIALALAQCEEIEGCAPNVTEEELDDFIEQITARLEELLRRASEALTNVEKAELEALIAGYQEELKNFIEYRKELQAYLTVEEDEDFEEDFEDEEFGDTPTTSAINKLNRTLEGVNARIQWLESLRDNPEERARLGQLTGIELTQEALEAIIEGAKSEAKFIEKQLQLLQNGTEAMNQSDPLFIAMTGDQRLIRSVNYGPSLLNLGGENIHQTWY